MRVGRRTRRIIAVLAALSPLLAASAVLPSQPGKATDRAVRAAIGTPQVWADRAAASYRSLQQNLYHGAAGHNLYRETTSTSPGHNPYSYVWEFREASQATLDLQNITGNESTYRSDIAARFAALQQYVSTNPARPGFNSYLPPPLGKGGDLYYDDNAEVGLSLLSAYHANGDRSLIDRARTAFAADVRGWDTAPGRICPGGVRWVEKSSDAERAANSTGFSAQLSVELYQITGQRAYLDWAKRAYQWNRTCLMQSAGLYWDSCRDDGTVNTALWSYNSGSMIGTAVQLYRTTGDRRFLNNAIADANGALAYWTKGDRLYNQPAIFNVYFFRDLLLLDSQHHDARYLATLQYYAARLWVANRNPTTGLFQFKAEQGGAPDPTLPVQTLNQSAVVQLFSLLAWDPTGYARIS
ncbi:MAG: hydrolase [Streptomycetaceae bacterium]|nr:hydrolase [Streptomycetaceae bacterium]